MSASRRLRPMRNSCEGEGLQFSGIGPAWGFADYARIRRSSAAGWAVLSASHICSGASSSRLLTAMWMTSPRRSVGSTCCWLIHAHRRAGRGGAGGCSVGDDQRVSRPHPDRVRPAGTDARGARVGSDRRVIYRAAWRTTRFNMGRLFDPPVNRARRRVGLPAVSDAFFSPVDSGQPYLVMASPAVIDRPADWPQNMTLTALSPGTAAAHSRIPRPGGVPLGPGPTRLGDAGGEFFA